MTDAKQAESEFEKLIGEALRLKGEERERLVLENEAEFPLLGPELDSLLEHAEDANSFFEAPAAVHYSGILDFEQTERVGNQIGNFQIIRELKSGGMGSVYLAKRIDGSFEQVVALKLLRREFNTEKIRQRFEREKEIQAGLHHPNIARLVDAGMTSDGTPYIAMEYIDGKNIDRFCFEDALTVRDKLRLFIKVCEAVSFAHQNLVVHRDLKPSNILVDKNGEPTLLDFGIAKVLASGREGERTITKLGLMTPEYASPEQVKGESVSTSTDVYSLAVVLFELLTGQRPYEFEDRSPAAVLTAIVENEPKKPSEAVVSGSDGHQKGSGTVRKRDSSASNKTARPESSETLESRLETSENILISDQKYLRGDLDNIVLKGLRKEPKRRYRSVDDLASDVERHLDGLPVSARPSTLSYRTGKFVKRNKLAVAAFALVAVSLIAGFGATVWQWREANLERTKAEKRFEQVRSLAKNILFEVYPDVERLEGSIEARKKIVTNAKNYLDGLAAEAKGDTELQIEVAVAYAKVGDVLGNNKFPNLGDLEGSAAAYASARKILEQLFESGESGRDVANELAEINENEGFVVWWQGDNRAAYRRFEEAKKIRAALIESYPAEKGLKFDMADLELYFGDVPLWENKFDDAQRHYSSAHETIKKLIAQEPRNPKFLSKYAYSLDRLSKIESRKGNYKKAAGYLKEAEDYARRAVSLDLDDSKLNETLWAAKFSFCELHLLEKNAAKAVDKCEEAVNAQDRFVKIEPANATARFNLAISYSYAGRANRLAGNAAGAIKALEKGVEQIDKLLKNNRENIGYRQERLIMINSMAQVHAAGQEFEKAKEAFSKVMAGYQKILAEQPGEPRSKLNLFLTRSELGLLLVKAGSTVEGRRLLERSLKEGEQLEKAGALIKQHQDMLETVRVATKGK